MTVTPLLPRADRAAARTRWLLGILIACSAVPCAQADADFKSASDTNNGQTALSYLRSSLEIVSASGRQHFNVQVADTPERQELGLMFVMSLLPDQGMVFPLAPPRVMTMWMKNTFIPLDMLFVDSHWHIVCLRERTRPRSLDLISCDKPVSAVLEIAGGEVAARRIRIGDTVSYPAPRW